MLFDYDGKKIKSLRDARGVSMAELARRSGIKQPSLWAIERQITKRPKASTLLALAGALGVPLQELLRTPHKRPSSHAGEQLGDLYGSLNPGNQQALMAAAKALLESQGKK